ncbi:unnamed protein product, partial [Mesorhabditis belari]|uniref:Uncharacterized protein n=1 Tax=Mesorhabditis belari TaxID=2138241 RepID=A0AAF3F1L5_9BILA
MDEEQAYACAACSFTAKEERDLEEHSKVHELGEQCPLCNERPPVLNLHLIQEHKIAEAAVERLLAVHKADILPVAGDQFAFRCPSCPLAFKNETGLQQHSLSHVFKGQHACPFCGQAGESADALIDHMNKEHPEEERKLYCELCVEQFADKTQMLAHLNSVQHLHKAKRHLEQGGIDLNNQLQSLTSPLSPIERKPFRCNLCKLSYGQGATLDIHLRSVAHQSRIAKISELIQSAEVDASKPLTEQPSGPLQKTIAEVAQAKEEEAAQQAASNPMAMFNNILNMAQLFNMKPGLLPSTSTLDDDETAPKSVATLRKMIDAIGVEEFPDSMNLLLQRLDDLSDDYVSDLVKGDCETCFQSFTSILTLKAHYEDTHEMNIPMSVLENFVTRLSKAVDEAGEESNPGSGDGSRSVSRDNSEPPEKKSRGENDVHLGDQTAQMALLNMMQGFPFLQPNPFMPMDGFFNPLLAQQMAALQAASSPAKRARTRITDDQLKVLRQYFDINNSPTEAQIKDMSVKTMLPEKVIKHWFRNTLFKERQRDKDSPYNFSVPPQMSIDLDTYEKTGEAKVVSLTPEQTNGATTPTSSTNSVEKEFKQEVKLELKEPKPPATLQALPEPPNLAALIGNLQQQNPFSFMADKEAFSSLLAGAMPGLAQVQQPTAGRRANRTRFTDYQLRTLQQFFDKQAYPKDDDLELLSKKLQLSPRVIVVWFQNARQKARKIYENQPNAENSERFVRTPGCNFQCKRCSLVFQRYYELIQHQQKKCYKDDCQAQLQDNKGVEGHLTEAEKEQLACNQETPAPESPALPDPAELLKLLGQGKSSTEALLKMCESARIPITPGNPLPTPSSSSTPSNFHKRCPFCCLLFRSRQSLLEHLPTKHNLQMQRVPVDVDLLPNADDVPSLSSTLLSGDGSAPLDLSSNGSHERNESLSVSPFLGAGSDVDDACEDIFSALAQQSMHSSQGDSRSPANNKRYRTHLTPIQVHVMKCIFTEYKTPSMAECDKLGREIGLHKRVVQVWFQNARAKERKTRMQNGQDEEVSRPLPRSCTYCSIEFSPTVSLQDHVFSPPHLTMLRSLHKGDDADVRPTDENGLRSRAPIVRDSSPKKAAAPLNPQEFPFNLLNFGIQPGTLPMLYDPTVMGTPIPLLQIPETVMQQISTDLSEGRSSTKFTQDGLTFDALVSGLAEEDAKCAAPKNSEVGWACPRCTNVFQQETLLAAHQRSICSRSEGHLTLVQTHYECLACGTHFGTQQDFKAHLSTDEHRIAKAILFPAVSSKNTSNTSPLESF